MGDFGATSRPLLLEVVGGTAQGPDWFGGSGEQAWRPPKSLTCLAGIKDPEGSCSLRTLLHFCTASSWSLWPDSALPGPCSGRVLYSGPSSCLGTQPTGEAALLTWPDLDWGSCLAGTGKWERTTSTVDAAWTLRPGDGGFSALLSPSISGLWFWNGPSQVVQDTEPQSPSLPRGTRDEEDPPTHTPPGRPGSTSVVESSAPTGLAWKETSALSTQGTTRASLFSPDLHVPHQPLMPNLGLCGFFN